MNKHTEIDLIEASLDLPMNTELRRGLTRLSVRQLKMLLIDINTTKKLLKEGT